MGRAALVGIPTWIVLLALLPFSGLGPEACLTIATVLAVAVIVVAERRQGRRGAAGGAAPGPRRRSPMGPLAAAGLTLAGVAALVYVIFVVRNA